MHSVQGGKATAPFLRERESVSAVHFEARASGVFRADLETGREDEAVDRVLAARNDRAVSVMRSTPRPCVSTSVTFGRLNTDKYSSWKHGRLQNRLNQGLRASAVSASCTIQSILERTSTIFSMSARACRQDQEAGNDAIAAIRGDVPGGRVAGPCERGDLRGKERVAVEGEALCDASAMPADLRRFGVALWSACSRSLQAAESRYRTRCLRPLRDSSSSTEYPRRLLPPPRCARGRPPLRQPGRGQKASETAADHQDIDFVRHRRPLGADGVGIGEQLRKVLAAVVMQPGRGVGEAARPLGPVALEQLFPAARRGGGSAIVHPVACPPPTLPRFAEELTRSVVSFKPTLAGRKR